MKDRIYIAIVITLVCAMIGLGIYCNRYMTETSYNEAISLIQDAKYEDAITKLTRANPNNNFDNDLKRFISYGRTPEYKYYKDSWTIYQFIKIMQEYTGEKRIGFVKRDLDLIPKSYSGDLSKEISDFRIAIEPEVLEYEAEQKRRDEELMRKVAESERQYYAKLKNKIPYEGMSESDINRTIMGKYHDIDTDSKYGKTKYYWKTNSGDIMLIVTCKDKKVSSVNRYGWGYFWTDDIKPIWDGKNPYTSSSYKSKKKSKKTDPYNVNDYSDPEDFYYDNYDDFWEYEEAEDYYNTYHEDP